MRQQHRCTTVKKYEWSYDLLKKLGIPTDILTDVIFPGEIVGKVKPELAEELWY